MSNIGSFKRVGNDYIGEINTLGVSAQNVRIVDEGQPANEDAPTHRIYAGKAEIGVAWSKLARADNRPYLSVKLDDPSFPAAINANLFKDDHGDDTYSLIWSRSRPNGG
ncbi:DUF736 domain-containing protein [Asticcacaulis endophyticus]|uniref:DUF736 domain-containing protein n=1 Tax=Asticcacaulis endophyticus TaxID=1395890 RepID=A0A918USU0_9CAUL|nr:DUF736 domain-containing protein [Asticcacaulis endophyticus]GGZ32611.1 hypothetical protein GCM10011273_18480 [Asticcacaulis endophyticus]